MHISKLTLVNYRNFANAKFLFKKGVNTLIGENGAGKTNVFRALRLLLDDTMIRAAHRLDESDFHRGLGRWQGHWIIISLEFQEVSQDEAMQALFLHGTAPVNGAQPIQAATYTLIFRPNKQIRLKLAALEDFDADGMNAILDGITIDDYETIFTGRSTFDFSDPTVYRSVVGNFQAPSFSSEIEFPGLGVPLPSFLSVSKEVCLTYIQALRDVVSEFHNNRTNPLLTLLKSKSGEIDPLQLAPIVTLVQSLNTSIAGLADVQKVRSDIRETINGAAGLTYSPASLSIRSDLPEEADKLFQSLRLFVGESEEGYEGAIHELSLGGANLIYLTLKLLEFKYQRERQSIANFLLIEEPEAHLHTHVQKTLFDRIGYQGAQIIYSTHSTHISEVSNIENVNILGKKGVLCEAFHPAQGLQPTQVTHVQRFLDAVRCNLLFAKSVVLVEGDAEEILIPLLIKTVWGVSLDELGISLINIRSTGFDNLSVLFDDARIRRRCSIITDLDASFMNTTPLPGDDASLVKMKDKLRSAQEKGHARRQALDARAAGSPWIKPFYAANTFEIDFVASGNARIPVRALPEVYTQAAAIEAATNELQSGQLEQFGRRILVMASNSGKGWFAILLGKYVDWQTVIPPYIRKALVFAHGPFSRDLIFSILKYRVRCIHGAGVVHVDVLTAYWGRLLQYQSGHIDFATMKADTLATLGDIHANAFLEDIS